MKLSPDQISKQWEEGLCEAIEEALPPLAGYEDPSRMNNVLSSLLAGKMVCWELWLGDEIYGVGVFQVTLDEPSGIKNLLIYALYTYKPFSYDFWYLLLKTLRQYAKEQGCHRIVGFTDVDRIISIVNALGGSSEFRYIWLEV